MQGTLEHYRSTLGGVGWFIPPYITMGFLSSVCADIHEKGELFTQDDLEVVLARAYLRFSTLRAKSYLSEIH